MKTLQRKEMKEMKKKIIALVILGLVVASGAFGQTTADEWYSKGREYRRNKDYANAITAFSEAIKLDSTRTAPYLNRGYCYFELKNYNAAIADYSTAIKINPNWTDAYWSRGFTYYQLKNYDAAIADYSTYIGKEPENPFAYAVRGDLYGAKGIFHKAVPDYIKGFEKGYEPNDYSVDKTNKADMWFCGALYMEIVVNRFLGKSDVVTKYENFLKTVCDKNKVTRAEVEAYYRNGIRSLISDIVDEEFKEITVPPQTVTFVKQEITNFMLTPNQANFERLKAINTITKEADNSQKFCNSGTELLTFNKTMKEMGFKPAASEAEENRIRNEIKVNQNFLNEAKKTFNVPSDASIDWDRLNSTYRKILNDLNTELVKKM